MNLSKYIGRTIVIIYQDGKGAFTKRRISVRGVISGKVRAFDIDKRAPRVFDLDRILAAQPGRTA